MTAPTAAVREGTYFRDENRCVRCGRYDLLTYQHRQASGMGGVKRQPEYAEGLTACAGCNARFESDLQDEALAKGWKVRRWVKLPALIPVFYGWCDEWWLLGRSGGRSGPLEDEMAEALIRLIYEGEMADARR